MTSMASRWKVRFLNPTLSLRMTSAGMAWMHELNLPDSG